MAKKTSNNKVEKPKTGFENQEPVEQLLILDRYREKTGGNTFFYDSVIKYDLIGTLLTESCIKS